MKALPLSLLLLTLAATSLAAEPSKPPITIEADRLEMRHQDGQSRYQGNVELQQGEMTLHADTLEIRQRDGQLRRAIADGAPARLRLPDEETGQLIRAEARQMDYQLDQDRIELHGEAVLWRGKDEFRGEHLVYYIEERRVEASGTRSEDGSNGRVRIILQQDGEP